MSEPSPRSVGRSLLGFALAVLLAALCLHWAVQLLAAVWPWLLGIGLVVVFLVGLWHWLRWRRQSW